MKYVYGKKLKTFRDRMTTGIAALALLANSVGMSLPFILTQRAAAATSVSVCYSGCDHASIQAAIDTAASGDTIAVEDGTYNEGNVTIDKSLTIRGSVATQVNGKFIINESGADVVIADLSLTHDSTAAIKVPSTVSISSLALDNVTITSDKAVHIADGTASTIGTLVITDSVINSNYPVYVDHTASIITITGNTFNTVNGNRGVVFAKQSTPAVNISGNTFNLGAGADASTMNFIKYTPADSALLTSVKGSNTFTGVATMVSTNGESIVVDDTPDTTKPTMVDYQLSSYHLRADGDNPTLTGTTTDDVGVTSTKYAIFKYVNGKRTSVRSWGELPTANGTSYGDKTVETDVVMNLKNLPEGTYEFSVRAWDAADNKRNGGDFAFYVDNTAPTFSLTDDGNPRTPILDGAIINPALLGDRDSNNDSIRFSKESATDTLYVNNKLIFKEGYYGKNSGQIGAAFRNDGVYTLYTRDLAGNQSESITFTVDTTAPAQPQVLGFYKDNDKSQAIIPCGGYTNSTKILIDWENNSEDDIAYYWFGTKFNQYHKKVTVSEYKANMTPGNNPYYYTVIAVDHAGNESEISNQCGVTLDQDVPNAPTLTSPFDGAVVNGATIVQTWSTDDADIDYFIYESYNDSTANSLRWSELFTDPNKSALNVNESTYWWRVQAVDYAGNVSGWSNLWKITVDNTAPTTEILSANIDDSTISFTGNVSDDNLRYYYCWLTTNQTVTVDDHTYTRGQEVKLNNNTDSTRNAACNTTWANGTTSFSNGLGGFNITGFPAGEYTINLVAYDLAGNNNVATPSRFVVQIEEAAAPTLTADYFTVHPGQLGVGFSIDKFDDATLVEVAIYDADKTLITQNIGDSTDMLNLINSHTGQISSPFYIPFGDATDGYWTFSDADWANVTPAYAVVTVYYGDDSVSDEVVFTPVNEDNPDVSYAGIVAGLSTDEGGSTLGETDCDGDGITDPNGCDNGNGSNSSIVDRLTGRSGSQGVLGANDGLTNTGTQNGGLLILVATTLMTVALATLRRKQEA